MYAHTQSGREKQRHIFKHCQAQARMLAQKRSRDTFSNISRRKPECWPRSIPETHFQAFPGASQNVGPEWFQAHIFKHFQAQARMWVQNASTHIFKHFQAQARMWVQNASRHTFSSISRRKPECLPRTLPDTHFQAFPDASQNVSPERFQTHIFKHFQARARM